VGPARFGTHIGEQLLTGGAREVILLDNLSLGSVDTIQFLLADSRCTFVRGDVLRLNELLNHWRMQTACSMSQASWPRPSARALG